MLLDLFITHWTEPFEVGDPGIRMLSLQRLVDWNEVNITIVHDGSEPFPEEKLYGLKVNQVSIPHGGIAKARNWCLDHSTAKWIKWCDFDDMFSNVYALRDILNVLPDDKNEMLWFELLYEDIPEKNMVYLKKERDPVFVHNKIFRRRFLKDHEIRFKEDLTWCEDSAFMAVVEMEIDHEKIGKIVSNSPLYIYSVRPGSLCHRPEIRFKNLQSFFDRHCYVRNEFLKRGLIDQYNTMMVRIMGDAFYTCKMAPNITEDRSEFEKKVLKFYDQNRESFYACRPENFELAMEAVNRENNDGGYISTEMVMEWLQNHEKEIKMEAGGER